MITTRQPPRTLWLDVAKGAGIVLVVIGHALGGLIDSTLGADFGIGRRAFFAVYTFHMPLFIMLSGLLVAQRLERNRSGFQRSLWINIAWPYVLWSVVQFTIIYQLGSLVNQPVANYWGTIVSLPWHTVSQFWFLYALFVLHVAAIALLGRVGVTAFLLICLALKPLALLIALPEVINLAANQAPYYGIGVFLGQAGISAMIVTRPRWVRGVGLPMLAIALVTAALLAAGTFNPALTLDGAKAAGIANLAWHIEVFPAALAGSFAIIALSSLSSGRGAILLSYLGRKTMSIFVFHIMAIAGCRIALVRFAGVDNVWLVLAATVAAGLALPLIADFVVARLRLSRALGLG